jgi:hypothetical protein
VRKVLAGIIHGAKSPIAHTLEDPTGYYFKPSDKPPVKAVLVRHLVALNGRHSTVTCFLSSHKDAEGGDFVEIAPKTDASQSVVAKSGTEDKAKVDTEDKAKVDTDHEPVPEKPVAKKQSSDSDVEDLACLLVKLYIRAHNIKSKGRPVARRAILLGPARVSWRGL